MLGLDVLGLDGRCLDGLGVEGRCRDWLCLDGGCRGGLCRGLGLRVGCGLRRGWRSDSCLMETLAVGLVIFAAQRATEVAEPTPQRLPDFGEPLRSEDDQRNYEDQEQVGWLKDVADHVSGRLAGLSSGPQGF